MAYAVYWEKGYHPDSPFRFGREQTLREQTPEKRFNELLKEESFEGALDEREAQVKRLKYALALFGPDVDCKSLKRLLDAEFAFLKQYHDAWILTRDEVIIPAMQKAKNHEELLERQIQRQWQAEGKYLAQMEYVRELTSIYTKNCCK